MATDLTASSADEEVIALGDDLFDGFGDDQGIDVANDEEETEESTAESEEVESESEDHAEEEATEEEAESKSDDTTEQPEEVPAAKYTLKHLDDDPKEYTAEELVPLAQKGLDYDRIRSERDGMKENYARYEQYAKFLENIKGKFESIEDLMDDTNATLLVKNEADNGRTITKEEALNRVKKNRETEFKDIKPSKASKEENKTEDEDAKRTAEVQRFSKALADDGIPVPKWNDLPEEVRKAFEKSGELTVPYYRYLAKQRENENKTLKQNNKNKERSTGSRVTKGKSDPKNKLFDGWGDD